MWASVTAPTSNVGGAAGAGPSGSPPLRFGARPPQPKAKNLAVKVLTAVLTVALIGLGAPILSRA